MERLITYVTDPPIEEQNTWVAVTGHMVDKPTRVDPRFLPESVPGVRETLIRHLELLEYRRGALRVLTSGTQGVDLLAIAYCLQRGWPADMYLPMGEEAFLARAVTYGNDARSWLAIYRQAHASTNVTIHLPVYASAPARSFSAPGPDTKQHYVDVNNHLAALLRPQDILLAYWDGKPGDAPTGTEHMIRTALGAGLQCIVLNEHLVEGMAVYERVFTLNADELADHGGDAATAVLHQLRLLHPYAEKVAIDGLAVTLEPRNSVATVNFTVYE